ncbi:MAG: helix-turn-helix domain-containing protein [Pseudomonadota bacterium]
MHKIAILALNGVVPFDFSIPCDIFGHVRLGERQSPYQIFVCGESERVRSALFELRVDYGLEQLADADTIVIPGVVDTKTQISCEVIKALRTAATNGTRIASICTGAFILATTGLLDGQRATTHWRAAETLATRYPNIIVDPDVLFVDNGQFLTSAGASAGIDLCIYMIRCDYGATAAMEAAHLGVMPPMREGHQAQYIRHAAPNSSTTLQPLLCWLEENLDKPLALKDIAGQGAMSTRTLNRRFLQQIGTTPLQWLLAARIRRAQQLLEATELSVEQVATETGFGSGAAFRERFAKVVGTNPQSYRQAFRT